MNANGLRQPPANAVIETALDEALQRLDEVFLQRLVVRYLASPERDDFLLIAMRKVEDSWGSLMMRKRALRLMDVPQFLWGVFSCRQFDPDLLAAFFAKVLTEDRVLDVKLARLLPARGSVDSEDEASRPAILRLLDVLDHISNGARILMLICHLTSHSDCNVASKAAKLVGRRLHSRQWLEKHLVSSDARIRANVVEALWRTRSETAHDIFEAALRDRNNRVVGNALIGLHYLGDRSVPERWRAMLKDSQPLFRLTAIWAAVEIGDAAMLRDVERVQCDDNAAVRAAARRVLSGMPVEALEEHDGYGEAESH